LNKFQQILSPNPTDDGVWIHQDAWFHITQLEKGKELEYKLKKSGNGIYTFVLSGEIQVDTAKLSSRDALGVWDTNELNYAAISDAEILVMEVPMKLD
jgi:redox-sensitive bicupin YhaK (pirin superfamily)